MYDEVRLTYDCLFLCDIQLESEYKLIYFLYNED